MHGLLWGEGGELYANMRSAARQEDIYLSANHYGEIPPDPYAELKEENQLLKLQNKQLTQQLMAMKKESTHIGYNVENMTINMSGGTLVQHADLVQASGEVIVEKPSEVSSQTSVGASDSVFCLLTDQCRKEGKTEIVEAELRSACVSAPKLIKAIRTNEALGYLDTKNMSSQALYNALNDYFGLPFKAHNFAKYRSKLQ